MGLWGKMNNPIFNVTEFRNIKNESGSNGFVLSGKYLIAKFADIFKIRRYGKK
jgi:hypothetical protein